MGRKKKLAELDEEYYSDVYIDDIEEEEEEVEDIEPELCDYMGKEYFDIEDYE